MSSLLNILKSQIEKLLQHNFCVNVTCIEYLLDTKLSNPYYTKIGNTPYIAVNCSFEDYSGFIFQYSHEYTHHIMHTLYPCIFYHYDWFEEVICEAVSYWCLDWFAQNFDWAKVGLDAYQYHIKLYLKLEMDRHYQDDNYIFVSDRYFKSELTFNIKRPRLQIVIDLYKLLVCEEVWTTLKNYNPIKQPQGLGRPEWLQPKLNTV
ncbi:MAG: hypothetical protein FWF56_01045 [Firmicutes bacterium]|nr:hypothetical protein [Bacillota bacterium]MCL1954250.1 hypothetical protein [Bacillota bacterium]